MKQLTVLIVFVLIALGVGAWLIQKPMQNTAIETKLVLADFGSFADALQSVRIENAQGMLFNVKNVDGEWMAAVEAGQPSYPVSQQKLAELVQTLVQAKLLEAKTSKTEHHSRLGLQSIIAEDSIATLVYLSTSTKSWTLLVGKSASSGLGSYVRKPAAKQSWLSDKNVPLPVDQFSWLKQPILPYQQEDIVSVARVDKNNWHMTRDPQSNAFQLDVLPQGRTLQYDSILDAMASGLTALNFEALVRLEDELISSMDIVTELEVTTLQGTSFKVTVGQIEAQHYLYFTGENKEIYWQQWVYQVSNFSAQQLIKTVDDFLADQTSSQDDNVKTVSIDEGESPY